MRDFEDFLKSQNYTHIRKLEDGTWVAITRLLFTWAILVDLDKYGYRVRYCYDDLELAIREIEKMTNRDSIPEGWITRRPPELLKKLK